jgi:hypothetical protein
VGLHHKFERAAKIGAHLGGQLEKFFRRTT